jgi:hypothetical protein
MKGKGTEHQVHNFESVEKAGTANRKKKMGIPEKTPPFFILNFFGVQVIAKISTIILSNPTFAKNFKESVNRRSR